MADSPDGGGGPVFKVFAEIGGDNTNLKKALDDGLSKAKTVFGEMGRQFSGAFGGAGGAGIGRGILGGGLAGVVAAVGENIVNFAITEKKFSDLIDKAQKRGFGPDAILGMIQAAEQASAKGLAFKGESFGALFNAIATTKGLDAIKGLGRDDAREQASIFLDSIFTLSQKSGRSFAEVAGMLATEQGAANFGIRGPEFGGSGNFLRELGPIAAQAEEQMLRAADTIAGWVQQFLIKLRDAVQPDFFDESMIPGSLPAVNEIIGGSRPTASKTRISTVAARQKAVEQITRHHLDFGEGQGFMFTAAEMADVFARAGLSSSLNAAVDLGFGPESGKSFGPGNSQMLFDSSSIQRGIQSGAFSPGMEQILRKGVKPGGRFFDRALNQLDEAEAEREAARPFGPQLEDARSDAGLAPGIRYSRLGGAFYGPAVISREV